MIERLKYNFYAIFEGAIPLKFSAKVILFNNFPNVVLAAADLG